MVKSDPKSDPSTEKGEQTRRHIFNCALKLFREKGFDATTMLDIANEAGVVKSAAYYYFQSKEAIIQGYYEIVQAEQQRICAEAFAETTDLKKRITTAMFSKLDLARDDRGLLGVVFRYTGEPRHPLSCLGKATEPIRRRSIGIFEQAIAGDRMSKEIGQLLPLALWSLQMGLLVMFIYDESPGQQRTRKLAEGALSLTLKLLMLAKLPLLKPVLAKVLALLRDAELVTEAETA
jgi:AcrR family transcriptional regulator